MQRSFARCFVERSSRRLAVNGDDAAERALGNCLHPLDKSVLQSARIEQRENTTKGVVGRYAIGQFEKGPQKLELVDAVFGNLDPGIGPGDDRQDGDGDDLPEVV